MFSLKILKGKEVSSDPREIHHKNIRLDALYESLWIQITAANKKLDAWYMNLKNMKNFDASEYLVHRGWKLRLTDGLIAAPRQKLGKSICLRDARQKWLCNLLVRTLPRI